MSKQNLIDRWKNLKQPLLSNLTCKICNFTEKKDNFKEYKSTDIFYAGEIIRYQCPNCDVIFGDLRFLQMTDDEIGNDYKDLYSYYKEGNTSNYILHVIQKLNLGTDKTYLDYACGETTYTLDILRLHNYNVYGYDAYVNNIHPNFLKTLDIDTKYDVVYSNNFIEHVIHPFEDLKKLTNLLNINGKLVLITSCWEYCYEYTHYHTYFFLGKSVQYLCNALNIKEIFCEKINFKDGIFTIVKVFEKIKI